MLFCGFTASRDIPARVWTVTLFPWDLQAHKTGDSVLTQVDRGLIWIGLLLFRTIFMLETMDVLPDHWQVALVADVSSRHFWHSRHARDASGAISIFIIAPISQIIVELRLAGDATLEVVGLFRSSLLGPIPLVDWRHPKCLLQDRHFHGQLRPTSGVTARWVEGSLSPGASHSLTRWIVLFEGLNLWIWCVGLIENFIGKAWVIPIASDRPGLLRADSTLLFAMDRWVVWIDVVWILAVILIASLGRGSLTHGCVALGPLDDVGGHFWLQRMRLIDGLIFWQILSGCRHLSYLWLTQLRIAVHFILQLIICQPHFVGSFRCVDRRQRLNLLRLPCCLDCFGCLVWIDVQYFLFLGQTVDSAAVSFDFGSSLSAALFRCHVFVGCYVWVGETESLLTLNLNLIVAIHLNAFRPTVLPWDYLPYFAFVGLVAFPIESTKCWTGGWLDDKRCTFNQLLSVILYFDHILCSLLHILLVTAVFVFDLVFDLKDYLLAIVSGESNQLTGCLLMYQFLLRLLLHLLTWNASGALTGPQVWRDAHWLTPTLNMLILHFVKPFLVQ